MGLSSSAMAFSPPVQASLFLVERVRAPLLATSPGFVAGP